MINAPKKKKWAAVGIVTLLSISFGSLLRFSTDSMRQSIIERENLGDILAQIEQADVNVRRLTTVLREPPPLQFMVIAVFINVAITVWIYDKILGHLCKLNKSPNQASDPSR